MRCVKVTVQERESCLSQLAIVRQDRTRAGLTLIELLVTISVMATVAGMFIVAYRSASTEAFRVKSSSTLQKINRVLLSRTQEYELMEIPIGQPPAMTPLPGNLFPRVPGESVDLLLNRTRLGLTRQVIVQEMPDHPDDLKWSSKWVPEPISLDVQRAYLTRVLSLDRRFDSGLVSNANPVFATTNITIRTWNLIARLTDIDENGRCLPKRSTNGESWDVKNANAELLYLVVEDSQYNGSSAIELFGRSEIGDTDRDGLNEFLDAYGNPISWVRWPTSSVSVGLQHPDLLDPNLRVDKLGNEPIDSFKSDPGYAIYTPQVFSPPSGFSLPLVISPGPDREVGVLTSHSTAVNTVSFYRARDPLQFQPNNDDIRPSFSAGDLILNVMPYNPVGFLFVDPWYPRNTVSGLGSIDPTRSSFAKDDLTNFDLGGAGL